jgi:chromate transporter
MTSFDAPVFGSIDLWALALAVVAGVSLFRFKLGVMPTLAICSAASIAQYVVMRAV